MKGKRLVEEKIDGILMKRYAVEKVVTAKNLITVLVLSIFANLTFALFWIITSAWKNDHMVSIFYIFTLGIVLFVTYCIWRLIGNIIPKFALVGLLGWFLIGGDIISNVVLPGSLTVDNEPTNIRLPATRFTGFNEKYIDETPHLQKFVGYRQLIKALPIIFIAPDYYVSEKENRIPFNFAIENPKLITVTVWASGHLGSYTVYSNYEYRYQVFFKNQPLDNEWDKSDLTASLAPFSLALSQRPAMQTDKIVDTVRRDFLPLQLVFFFFLILILFDIFLTVSISRKTGRRSIYYHGLSWREREKSVKVKGIIAALLLVILFLLTRNYFFVLWVLLIIFTIFLVRWEIQQRGQNHKIYSRSVLFLFLIQMFSMAAGEIFMLIFLPIYLFINKVSITLSLYDAVLINWIVLIGSLASVLIGITTQVVWSGKRLTDKLNA